MLWRADPESGMFAATCASSGRASLALPLAGECAGMEGRRAAEGFRSPGSPKSPDGLYESGA